MTSVVLFPLVLLILAAAATREDISHAALKARVGDEKCMRVLGCFKITKDFFDLLRRPINFLPQDRAVINTKFLLFTRENIRETHYLDAEKKNTINTSYFDPKVPTKFIVHGYTDTLTYGKWHGKLKDEFLLKGDYNIIIVDWTGGNGLPYTQATANTRVVGAEIAYLIKVLKETVGLDPGDCHIVGHSLGAHVAGYAGERVPGLGRITGLDPAEPYFQDLPPSVRLDETDAEFVDVIHTDSKSILLLGLGMAQAVGHLDFYPNDGKDQPGCKTETISSLITEGIAEALRQCNHKRAVDFYQSSIVLTKCAFVGYACSSWKNFIEGKCTDCGSDGNRCAIMGERAIESKGLNQKNKKLYLRTSGEKPYCLQHYKVQIKLYRAKGSREEKGTLELKIGDSTAKLTPSGVKLSPGSTLTFAITTEQDASSLKSVSFRWTSKKIILNPLEWLRSPKINVEYIKIVPMSLIDERKRTENTKSFCPSNPNNAISSGKDTAFLEGTC